MRPAGKEAGISESKTGFGVSKGPLPPQRAQQGKESSWGSLALSLVLGANFKNMPGCALSFLLIGFKSSPQSYLCIT